MNKKKFSILKPAETGLDDAFNFYEYELQGLGYRFIDEFKKGLKRIQMYPDAWSLIKDNIRKCVLKKFPYTIIYSVEKTQC